MRLLKAKNSLVFIILLLVTGLGSEIQAQHTTNVQEIQEQFPNAHAVRLNEETTVTITIENGELKIDREITEENLYLDGTAIHSSENEISYSSFFNLKSIEASSFNMVNGKYKETKVEDFQVKNDLDEFFYDDTKIVSFIYPQLNKGSKSRLNYVQSVENPRFLSRFQFGDYIPILNNKVSIIADKDVELDFIEFNLEGVDIQYEKDEKRNTVVHTWVVKNVDEVKYEYNMPSIIKVLPHLIPVIKAYTYEGKRIKVTENVQDLYDWYYSLVEDLNQDQPSEELVSTVNKLIEGKKTPSEKAEAIFNWAQQNIKYIAVEYALGGFIPREANDVFYKKYGDCKDNTSIMKEMLQIAGLDGNITWIGTRRIPYDYSEVPTPLVDNHMILSFDDGGETLFLDATGRHVPYGYPTPFIQGKEALISYGKGSMKIKRVPVMEANKNQAIDTTKITLEDDKLIGKSQASYLGYNKMEIFNAIEGIDGQKLFEFYNQLLRKGNNKFLIKDFKEYDKFVYGGDFKLDFDFEIEDYVKSYGDEIYVNLNLNPYSSRYLTEDDRENEVALDFKEESHFVTRFDIPEGYKVDYLPEDFTSSSDLMKVSISYKDHGNYVTYEHKIVADFLVLNKAEQEEVNALIRKAEKAYKEVLVLKKTS